MRLVIVFATVALALLFAAPRPALAYDMPRVRIDAVVEEDGSLQVEEERTFAFDDDVNGVFWTIPITQNEQDGRSWPDVASLKAALVVRGADEPLERVGSAEPGENGVFTVEEDGDALRIQLFSPRTDGEEATFRLSYRLTGAVMAWADTAELYWQFVGPGWDEPSGDVSLTVSFAGATAPGAQAATDETFRAWGHGPLEGSVEPDAQSATVHYSVPTVRDGEFAEARIVFPASWVPGLVAASGSSTERLPQILEEEAAWAAEANARREQLQTVIGVGSVLQIALPAALLVAAVAFRLTRGRAPQASFDQKYLRELPSNDHPAVIAAFMEGGEAGERAFAVTLMKLTDEGVVGIVADDDGSGRGKSPAYRLRLLKPDVRDGEGVDAAALRVFFRGGCTESSFEELRSYAESSPDTLNELMDDFTAEVAAELASRGLSTPRGGFPTAVTVAGVALLAASFILAAFTDGATLLALGIGFTLTLVAIIVAARCRRITPEMAELRARCEAFRRWVEDCSSLGESIDVDRPEGRRMLVMATAVGVSDEVIAAFAGPRSAAADVAEQAEQVAFEAETFAYGYGGLYYPYPLFWWYFPWYGHRHSPHESVDSAYESAASSIASSLSASAGGSGGGFSGGGGGGVGGGGGGTF